jgi:hypothetical protein
MGNFTSSQGGLFWLSPLGSDDSRNSQTGGWTLREAAKSIQNQANSRGAVRLESSDQMVLLIARRQAGPCERQPQALKGELENNSRKPRDLVGKLTLWQPKKVQLTLSQGKKKKGDEVADDEDNDDGWAPVCHKTKWKWHCILRFVLQHSVSIHSSPCISDGQPYGGGIQMVNMIYLATELCLPSPSRTSPQVTEFPIRLGNFHTIISWLGKTIKSFLYSRGHTY